MANGNRWHDTCNKRGVRIAPKSVQSSLATLQGTTAQSSRLSFIDTLASALSNSVPRANATHSDTQGSSEKGLDESSHNEDQNSNRRSIRSAENSRATGPAAQGKNASQPAQQDDLRSGQSDDNTTLEKAAVNTSDCNSHRTASRRTVFTAQVASQFNYQASTTQAQLNGRFGASTTTSESLTSTSDSQEETANAQPVIPVSVPGADLQSQACIPGSAAVEAGLNSAVDTGSDREQAPTDPRTPLSAAGQVALQMTSADVASPPQIPDTGTAQLIDAAPDKNGMPTSDSMSMLQASLSAVSPRDGGLNRLAGKVNQSKALSSALGLNSDAGDSTFPNKPVKSGDASDLTSPSHSDGTASLQTQHAQTNSASTTAFEVKGIDVTTIQPVVNPAQLESHGATGPHTSLGNTGSEAHQGGGSESLASERWVDSESAGMPGFSTARLIQTMGETQMRVGMHSNEFGDISIRTAVSQQQMQAQISVDHNELGNAISAHIPSVQAKFGNEYGLHATIEVNQGGASLSNEGERSSQHQQQAAVRTVEGTEAATAIQSDITDLTGLGVGSGEYRLDIRA